MKTFATIFFTRQGYYTSTHKCEASSIEEARKINLKDLFITQMENRDNESDEEIAESLDRAEWCEVVTFEVVEEVLLGEVLSEHGVIIRLLSNSIK